MSETMVRLPRGGLAELCRVDMAGRWWLMPAVPYAGNRLLKRLSVSVAPLRVLGEISYSLYLIHVPVLLVVERLFGITASPVRYVLLGIVGSLLGGGLFYLAVERPAEAWRRRKKKAAVERRASDAELAPASE